MSFEQVVAVTVDGASSVLGLPSRPGGGVTVGTPADLTLPASSGTSAVCPCGSRARPCSSPDPPGSPRIVDTVPVDGEVVIRRRAQHPHRRGRTHSCRESWKCPTAEVSPRNRPPIRHLSRWSDGGVPNENLPASRALALTWEFTTKCCNPGKGGRSPPRRGRELAIAGRAGFVARCSSGWPRRTRALQSRRRGAHRHHRGPGHPRRPPTRPAGTAGNTSGFPSPAACATAFVRGPTPICSARSRSRGVSTSRRTAAAASTRTAPPRRCRAAEPAPKAGARSSTDAAVSTVVPWPSRSGT